MSDLLKKGSEWLETMRTNHLASPVTYKRGQGQVVVNATLGKTDYETSDESGFTVKAHTNDFLLIAVDLMIDDDLITPKIGDQIIVTRAGAAVTFEVLALPSGECWRYSDPFGKTLRIHTKQVS